MKTTNKRTKSKPARLSLTELIPIEKLQTLQDSFAACIGIASSLTDPDGRPITRPSNHSAVCTLIRTSELGMQNCIFSAEELGREARTLQQPVRRRCRGIGFSDAVAPIIVDGHHIANWIIGQYHAGAVDEQRVRAYAREIGVDAEQLVRAYHDMPRISTDELDARLAFLNLMVNELSELAYLSLIERKQVEELRQTKKELEQHRNHLEELVRQRTTDLERLNRSLAREVEAKQIEMRRQERLVAAIESAAESIVITTPSGEILYSNPAFSELTGYTREDALGKNPRVLKSGRHEPSFYKELWETITAGRTWKGRFINKKKDGTLYVEDGTITPIKDQDGSIRNFVAVKHDVTRELELEQQLRQSQRLESLGTLASGLAHEINSPIQFMLSNTEYVRESLTELFSLHDICHRLADQAASAGAFIPETLAISEAEATIDPPFLRQETDSALLQVIDGCQRIAAIVGAMKDYSGRDGLEKHQEDINALIVSVITITSPGWQQFAELELDLADNLPALPLFSGSIKDTLHGIITNAVYALKEKLGPQPLVRGRLSVVTRLKKNQVEIRIGDSGIGIPSSQIEKIFDPFFTTKPVGQGHGQGLSAAYQVIVGGHGGSIRAVSQPGEGTEFIIHLPITPTDVTL